MMELTILDYGAAPLDQLHLDDYCALFETAVNEKIIHLYNNDRYVTNIRLKSDEEGWPVRVYIEHRFNRKKIAADPQVTVVPLNEDDPHELERSINQVFHKLQSEGRYIKHWWITNNRCSSSTCVLIYHAEFVPGLGGRGSVR